MSGAKVLVDTWYSQCLDDSFVPFNTILEERCPEWMVKLIERNGMLRGILLFWFGRSYDLIVTTGSHPGSLMVLLLEAWFGGHQRRVILLEFLRGTVLPGWRRFLYALWVAVIIRPSMQRAMKAGQVMTRWEREHYAKMYGISEDRFCFIPFPLRRQDDVLPIRVQESCVKVLSSGRAACDWDTLVRAATGRDWPLTIISGRRDLHQIKPFGKIENMTVYGDMPTEECRKHLHASTIYVISLREMLVSSGHVRLHEATRAGIPVVATRVRGLDGYVIDNETALLVEPGDYLGMRNAIEHLLLHEDERRRLATNAFERAGAWTYEQYFSAISAFIVDCLEQP